MAHSLLDASGRSAGTRHDALEHRTLGGRGTLDVKVISVKFVIVFSVRHSGPERLAKKECRLLGREVQETEGVRDAHSLDFTGDFASLLVGNSGVLCDGFDFHGVAMQLTFRGLYLAGIAHFDGIILADQILDNDPADPLADIHHQSMGDGLVLAVDREGHSRMHPVT